MLRQILSGLMLLAGTHLPALADASAARRVDIGVYAGTGRACAGSLAISDKRISWDTPFSHCRAPYAVIGRQDSDGTVKISYRLQGKQPRCRYTALLLSHDGNPNKRIGWSVTGFPSEAELAASKLDDALACYLTK